MTTMTTSITQTCVREAGERLDGRSAVRTDVERLLAVTAPSVVVEQIKRAVKDGSADQIAALHAALANLQSAAPAIVHCVRCHEAFDSTAAGSCRIEHPEWGFDGEGERGGAVWHFKMRCCGLRWTDEDDCSTPPKPYCIVAQHTVDPSAVAKYRPRARTTREPIVKTCAEAGCK